MGANTAVLPEDQLQNGNLDQNKKLTISNPTSATSLELQSILDQFDPLTVSTSSKLKNAAITHDSKADNNTQKENENAMVWSGSQSSQRQGVSTPSPHSSSNSLITISNQPRLPRPDSQSEELPFDFQRFLDQLRHKGADPIARYLKRYCLVI